ncbi:hypothetical protein ACHAWC_009231 [Mediolabrus comicus]
MTTLRKFAVLFGIMILRTIALTRAFSSIKTRSSSNNFRCIVHYATASDSDLKMDNIYLEWSLDDDRILHNNRHLSTVRLASMLGRGMHGVEARIKKITDVESAAYRRLFAGDDVDTPNADETTSNKLTPVKEVLRRIQWDPTLDSSAFTIIHYDRVEDTLSETNFDAENDSIAGKERRYVFALPEHRIEAVKYLDRIVWNKEMRLDLVFGSMNGNGETIDKVVGRYDEWKREKEEKEERNKRRQVEILKEMSNILDETRVGMLKEMSSKLMHSEWDNEEVKDYVKRVVMIVEHQDDESGAAAEESEVGILHFLNLFSDLVALLPNEELRGAVLLEVETVINRHSSDSPDKSTKPNQILVELNEDELEADMRLFCDIPEKFVKGSGAGGQKINKTSNRVILIHTPTKLRVECQDTRSLQQNRKIARKRLRLKLDAMINGEASREVQKATKAVTKKAKNKARSKRRRQQKNKKQDEEVI